MGFVRWVGRKAKAVVTGANNALLKCALMGGLVLGGSEIASASPPPLIPSTGINVGNYVSEAFEALGAPLGIVIGCAFALIIVQLGVKFFRRFVK